MIIWFINFQSESQYTKSSSYYEIPKELSGCAAAAAARGLDCCMAMAATDCARHARETRSDTHAHAALVKTP